MVSQGPDVEGRSGGKRYDIEKGRGKRGGCSERARGAQRKAHTPEKRMVLGHENTFVCAVETREKGGGWAGSAFSTTPKRHHTVSPKANSWVGTHEEIPAKKHRLVEGPNQQKKRKLKR